MTNQNRATNTPDRLETLSLWITGAAAIAVIQYAPGATFTKTGEQVGSGIPLATLGLLVCLVGSLLVSRCKTWPVPRWSHVATFSLLMIGIMGLHSSEVKGGLKECIQLAEVFGASWFLFRLIPQAEIPTLFRRLGFLATGFLALGIGKLYTLPPFHLSEARWAGLVVISFPFALYAFRKNPKATVALQLAAAITLGYFLKNGGLLITWAVVNAVTTILLNRKWVGLGLSTAAAALILAAFIPGQSAYHSLKPMYDGTHPKRLFIEHRASLNAPNAYPVGGGLGEYKRTINRLKLRLNDEPSPEENTIPCDSNSQYLLSLVETGVPGAVSLLLLFGITAGLLVYRSWQSGGPSRQQFAAIAGALIGIAFAGLFTTTIGRGIGIWAGGTLGLSECYRAPSGNSFRIFILRFTVPAVVAICVLTVALCFNTKEINPDHLSSVNQMITGQHPADAPVPVPKSEPDAVTDTGLNVFQLDDDEGSDDEAATVRLEGEEYYRADPPIRRCKANDASGNMALEIPDKAGKGKGTASYKATIPTAGEYEIKARIWWLDGCSNSLRFVAANQSVKIAGERFKVWHDLKGLRRIKLPAGEVEIQVQNVEDGIMLDSFELILCK